ncbi:hypothetical protein [Macrococcus epidermidis]|uniref:hypothetical protein n=1 Tax=Macrococcus epidermidis TaxID=1902580 RepID=UPI0020B83F8B|nr:hypothetical protein [Macrococcus epidermidis]UTH15036.1 hypothetical protein KFV12_06750 [Macrococcus epidermidis]
MKIITICLQTKEISNLKEFYKKIGFNSVVKDNNLIIQLNDSKIIFENNSNESRPYYHFAIDIAPKDFESLKKTISEKVFLLTEDNNDEIYFEHINAKSFYINDPSGNIVEFIARNQFDNDNSKNIRYIRISEISLVTNKVNQTFKQLENYKFRERDNELIEEGLNFICSSEEKEYILLTKEGRRWLFSDKLSKSFPLQINTDEYILNFINDHLEIKKNENIL